jgi:hypothetical protein
VNAEYDEATDCEHSNVGNAARKAMSLEPDSARCAARVASETGWRLVRRRPYTSGAGALVVIAAHGDSGARSDQLDDFARVRHIGDEIAADE